MKKVLERTICTISAIILLWMVASFAEIISKNTEPNPEYSKANILVNIIEEANNNGTTN